MAILGYKNSNKFIRDFGLAEWLKTRGLAGWLEIAADQLEAPASQRISSEIGAHYAEAVGVHLAEGEPESSAQSTALAELGDPQKAALNFRKSHLTEREAKSMKSMEWIAAKPFFSFWALLIDGIPLGGVALFFSYLHRNHPFLLDFQFLVGLVFLTYVGFRLIPRLLCVLTPRRNCLRRELALCQLTTHVAFVLGVSLVPPLQDHDVFSIFNAVFLFFIYGCGFKPVFSIWNKLRKMDDRQNDFPPWQTTAP
jgi:hypothetical protein